MAKIGKLRYILHIPILLLMLAAVLIIAVNMTLVLVTAQNLNVARQVEERTHKMRNEIVQVSTTQATTEEKKQITVSHVVIAEPVVVSVSR